MTISIEQESITTLPEHGSVSIAFEYDTILAVSVPESGLGGIVLSVQSLLSKRTKNYDACDGASPTHWPQKFDTTQWGLIVARDDGKRIGGAVIAYNTKGVDILDGRCDLAVLWDIRIDPNYRALGVGRRLFAAVEEWAIARHCSQLKIETQNNNLAACKFYVRQGCALGAANLYAYPALPEEAQLFWYKDLIQKLTEESLHQHHL